MGAMGATGAMVASAASEGEEVKEVMVGMEALEERGGKELGPGEPHPMCQSGRAAAIPLHA